MLLGYDIDMLVIPDPLQRPGLSFTPVYDYEQVLVVSQSHPLASRTQVDPEDLASERLITYPVDVERLDIFNRFLLPAQIMPRQHKTIETTDIMLQMVAANRGVTALPRWLVDEYAHRMPIVPVRLGKHGLDKQIFLGLREAEQAVDYLAAFLALARDQSPSAFAP